MKNRLFIFGDSWCTPYFDWYEEFKYQKDDWSWYMPIEHYVKSLGFTPWNFPKYLEHHYEVLNHSCGGQSNESIIYQLGKLPEYKQGDRIIICLTHPVRMRFTVLFNSSNIDYHRRRHVDITPSYLPKYKKSALNMMMLDRQQAWDEGHRNDEKEFFTKITFLLKEYNPVLFSWSNDFIDTNVNYHDFTGLRIIEENSKYPDWHLGAKGNYLLYQKSMEWLENNDKLLEYYDGNIHT